MKHISLPTEPTVTEQEDNTATIEIGSLYPGYGTTLGNALRRILLSSLPGAAITSVKIEGADHEFTAFPGVKEDAIHVLLNLKQVRFKMHTDEPVLITLEKKGEGEVTAADFTTPSDVEVVTPDQIIATLTDKKATFKMEAEVAPGLGYEPAERRKDEKLPVGRIALDATYSPIRKANFTVENMRVGDRTDFNRLMLEVETDGSISPEDAFSHAVNILNKHIGVLGALGEPIGKEQENEENDSEENDE